MAVAAALHGGELAGELAQIGHGGTRIAQGQHTEIGGPHFPWQTLKQLRAEHGLDIAQYLRRSGLGHMHLLGRDAQIVRASEDIEQLEMLET